MLQQYFNHKQIKRYQKDIDAINRLYAQKKDKSVAQLAQMLYVLKGSKLGHRQKVFQAIAIAKAVSQQVLHMSYYDVQIMGALALIEGKIAQMKTGEGKTLMCSAAATANYALGYQTHVATANEYLAQRDEMTLRPLYQALGIKSASNIAAMSHEDKKDAYKSDILYSTSQEMGFDYLRDNLVKNITEKIQPQNFPQVVAIIDEADFILIDEARTPLIISGSSEPYQDDFYHQIRVIAKELEKMPYEPKRELGVEDIAPGDFWIDYKSRSIYLSDAGYTKLESSLQSFIKNQYNLYSSNNLWIVDEVVNALKAEYLYHRDKQYVVHEEEVVIVDENTGRLSVGRSWSDGLHQAIEAKENLHINTMTSTLRTVSIQNYFRHYGRICGMTGTAIQCREEFQEIYNCTVVEIPTNKKMVRIDHADKVFIEAQYKYAAIIEDIAKRHEKMQPILVGTTSVSESETISSLLSEKGIFHYVLNAKNHALEAQIISQAGVAGAVTVSTSMAGRGTDIILGGNKDEIIKIKESQREALGYARVAITQYLDNIEPHNIEDKGSHGENPGFNNLVEIQFFIDELFRVGLDKPQTHLQQDRENIARLEKILTLQIEEIKADFEERRQKAIEAGGLAVIGCSRNESRRIDDQIRGRAGRQGDVGESVFYISFEDNWLQVFAKSSMFNILKNSMEPDEPITSKFVTSSIEKAQKSIENMYFDGRKNTFQYDSILNESRVNFFRIRDSMISDNKVIKDILIEEVSRNIAKIDDMDYMLSHQVEIEGKHYSLTDAIDRVLDKNQNNREAVLRTIIQSLFNISEDNSYKLLTIIELKNIWEKIESKEISSDEDFRDMLRDALMDYFSLMQDDFWNWYKSQSLEYFDNIWIEYLSTTEEIRNSSGFSGLIQKNPIYEYKKSCYELFKSIIEHFTSQMLNEMLEKIDFTIEEI